MDHLDASDAINKRWLQLWPAMSLAAVGVSVAYSTDNVVKAEGGALFARMAIISLDTEQETMGPVGRKRTANTGIIEVRLSCLPNAGTTEIKTLARVVKKIFRGRIGKRPGERGVSCRATAISELRRDTESTGRWIISTSTPFDYTELT